MLSIYTRRYVNIHGTIRLNSRLVPISHPRGEGLGAFRADSSGLLSGEEFPSANHIVENTICGCNAGNPWLLQRDDTALFGGVN